MNQIQMTSPDGITIPIADPDGDGRWYASCHCGWEMDPDRAYSIADVINEADIHLTWHHR